MRAPVQHILHADMSRVACWLLHGMPSYTEMSVPQDSGFTTWIDVQCDLPLQT